MTTNTSIIFKVMHVLFWIIFIGLCIKTGALLFSFIVSVFVNEEGTRNLYEGLNLSQLYAFDKRHYVSMASLIISLSALKAYIAYLVIQIFLKFNLVKPFSTTVSELIATISHVALGTGLLAIFADGYAQWLMKKGVNVPGNWESSEFLFLAGIIFIIAQVFKKGVELQTENDLTV